MTHPLGLSWRMTSFPSYLEPTFVFVRARGQGYGCLLRHLFTCFTLHILFSLHRCVFVLVRYNPQHLVFSRVNVDTSCTHLACI
jgi:hypothetical protein